jgi:hypothetical protein
MSKINAVLQVNAFNPFDKLVFNLDGILMPHGPVINYVSRMVSSDVLYWFRSFAERALMAMAIRIDDADDAIALHRLFSLWQGGQPVEIINLIVQERTYTSTDHVQTIIKPTLKLTQVKIDAVIPVKGEISNATYYLINLNVTGRRHWTEREGDI